jgi:hypothetical protein
MTISFKLIHDRRTTRAAKMKRPQRMITGDVLKVMPA